MFRFLFISFLLISSPAFAQSVDIDRLNEIKQAQEKEKQREKELSETREAVQKDIGRLKADLTKLAADTKAIETEGRSIENKLNALETQSAEIKNRIYGDKKTVMRLLAALQRIEQSPPPALLVSPNDAAEAFRSARLMSSLSVELKSEAKILSDELNDLTELQESISDEQDKLRRNEVSLSTKRKSITQLVGQKTKLEKSISKDQQAVRKRVAALASEADDLRDLIAKFESAARDIQPRLKPERDDDARSDSENPRIKPRASRSNTPLVLPSDTPRFSKARGKLQTPVIGKLKKGYSSANKGLTVATAGKAQVVSPYAGRIEFSGPFKNYENVVILNVGDGYFILLTGLGEIYTKAGEVVKRGEPLGIMPNQTRSKPELYLELRKDGSTINPSPWLGTAFAKSG